MRERLIVEMDKKIQRIIKEWKKECGISRVVQWKLGRDGNLQIYTSQPGFMIGREGKTYYKYKEILEKELGNDFKTVTFEETSWWWA